MACEQSRLNVDKYYEKLTTKEQQIKQLLRQNKKEEARRQLTMFKVMKDQIIHLEQLCSTLEKELIKLEVNIQSGNLINALQTAQSMQKDQEKLRDNLENIVMDLKDKEAQENEIKNLLTELNAENPEEQEELDSMLSEFERQVVEDKMKSITNAPVKQIAQQNQNLNQQNQNVNQQYQNVNQQSQNVNQEYQKAQYSGQSHSQGQQYQLPSLVYSQQMSSNQHGVQNSKSGDREQIDEISQMLVEMSKNVN